MGTWIVEENWKLPLAFLLICGYFLLIRATRAIPETYILSLLVFGYIVGNRGFAQIKLLGNLPLFMGELGLLIGAVFLALHISLKKELPFRMNALGITILLWIILGTIRVVIDYPNYGILALRDFAMVYYAAFFFIAQPMAGHLYSRKIFETIFQTALFLLIPGFLLFQEFTEYFLYYFVYEGAPLIYYKGDLAASFFGLGFVYYYCKYGSSKKFIYLLFAYCYFLLTLYSTVRAAWVGLLLGSIVFFLTKKLKILKHGLIAIIIIIPSIAFYLGIVVEDYRQTRPFAIYEHVVSLTDISGTGIYKNKDSLGSGANNRYRIILWKTVVEQTLQQGPVFGLGFGYDMTSKFFLRYRNAIKDQYATRSPHSIILSTFGRMGFIGFFVLCSIICVMVMKLIREISYIRSSESLTEAFPYWCMSWLIFISACFGVVIEGPMGAIVFWILLGIADSLSRNEAGKRAVDEIST